MQHGLPMLHHALLQGAAPGYPYSTMATLCKREAISWIHLRVARLAADRQLHSPIYECPDGWAGKVLQHAVKDWLVSGYNRLQ